MFSSRSQGLERSETQNRGGANRRTTMEGTGAPPGGVGEDEVEARGGVEELEEVEEA